MTENTTASGAADALRAAITRAFNLGQTYWQQADSESYAEQDKSDSTYKKYKALLEETCTTLVASAPVAPAPHPDLRVQVMEIITGVWDHDTQIDDATDDVLDLAAAPKAAPGDALDEALRERDDAEDFIDELLDEVLGADRPEWSSAYNRYDAMNDVRERITGKPEKPRPSGRGGIGRHA